MLVLESSEPDRQTPAGLTRVHAIKGPISSSPSSNRTFGFPEYGFPIIFFQRLSQSESMELWSESCIIPSLHRETSPINTPCWGTFVQSVHR